MSEIYSYLIIHSLHHVSHWIVENLEAQVTRQGNHGGDASLSQTTQGIRQGAHWTRCNMPVYYKARSHTHSFTDSACLGRKPEYIKETPKAQGQHAKIYSIT